MQFVAVIVQQCVPIKFVLLDLNVTHVVFFITQAHNIIAYY